MTLVVGQAYMSDYNMTREHVFAAGVAARVCRSPTEPYRLWSRCSHAKHGLYHHEATTALECPCCGPIVKVDALRDDTETDDSRFAFEIEPLCKCTWFVAHRKLVQSSGVCSQRGCASGAGSTWEAGCACA